MLSSPVAARLVADRRRTPARGAFSGEDVLSGRELEVAWMVAAGAANREIATRPHITEGTVKNHVSSVLRKLGLRDRTQLALRLTERRS
ncbi:response regulator transcription factor [Nonomuraea sp. PA05]|uniref:response regulator transcription factor n=1 Tax=Nonomuraea sp. PA05 TaxID=2604466 RepID=UPI0021CD0831|nr:LuxR C-terminal-related transcriptional regulator [Nonomuraea sp. PA05]